MTSETNDTPTLLQLLHAWPVTVSLVERLPLSSLLRLARTNSEYRSILHDFKSSGNLTALNLGQHQTPTWQTLKRTAIWECSSPRHTRGSNVNLCRQCCDPICDACIVKSSIGRSEHTFKNRCRFLCNTCWANDTPIQGQKFSKRTISQQHLYNFAPGEGEFCICTSREGVLCLACKDKQNLSANDFGLKKCIGQNCNADLEDDKDRRRICLWCERPMLRARASMQSKVAFDQRLIEARISDLHDRKARPTEHNSRVYMYRKPFTRRELRRSKAVQGDKDADTPQYLRHLDLVNYEQLSLTPPSSQQIWDSLLGKFRYNIEFLMNFRSIAPGAFPLERAAAEGVFDMIKSTTDVSSTDKDTTVSEDSDDDEYFPCELHPPFWPPTQGDTDILFAEDDSGLEQEPLPSDIRNNVSIGNPILSLPPTVEEGPSGRAYTFITQPSPSYSGSGFGSGVRSIRDERPGDPPPYEAIYQTLAIRSPGE